MVNNESKDSIAHHDTILFYNYSLLYFVSLVNLSNSGFMAA